MKIREFFVIFLDFQFFFAKVALWKIFKMDWKYCCHIMINLKKWYLTLFFKYLNLSWCPEHWNIHHKKVTVFICDFSCNGLWIRSDAWFSSWNARKTAFTFQCDGIWFSTVSFRWLVRLWLLMISRARMKRGIHNHYPGLMDFLHDEFHDLIDFDDHKDDKWLELFREQDQAHKHEHNNEK